jgi:hypothetical protein
LGRNLSLLNPTVASESGQIVTARNTAFRGLRCALRLLRPPRGSEHLIESPRDFAGRKDAASDATHDRLLGSEGDLKFAVLASCGSHIVKDDRFLLLHESLTVEERSTTVVITAEGRRVLRILIAKS